MTAFTSAYCLLDVMKGRKRLAKRIKKDGPLRVVIVADITDEFGWDDGDSIEFNCDVISVTEAA